MHVDGESFIARKRKDPKEPEFFPASAGSETYGQQDRKGGEKTVNGRVINY